MSELLPPYNGCREAYNTAHLYSISILYDDISENIGDSKGKGDYTVRNIDINY
jgi:hypothetical protein